MREDYPRIVFSALRGNSGKTFLSVGVSAYLRKTGKIITALKKGPDYIDAAWLALASGRTCYNLDLFLMERDDILNRVKQCSLSSEITLIEGNRGLFDGYDSSGSCSTAELAKMIDSPVILIVDCTKSTRTIAAMVLGCLHFDPEVSIKGVILNRVAGSRHKSVITNAIEETCGIPVLGAVPRVDLSFPERHMGLVPPQEHPGSKEAVDKAADAVGKYLDIDKICEIAAQAPPLISSNSIFTDELGSSAGNVKRPRIGVIKDSAFWFYYPDNLEALEKLGAEIVVCNAISQDKLPEVDALYIGGGFPETHAEALSGNKGFIDSLRHAVDRGLPVYAECGGLIYLGEKLIVDKEVFPMSGILPITLTLNKKPQGHGYTILNVDKPNPYFSEGAILFGHEFHYSGVVDDDKCRQLELVFKMNKGYGINGERDGIFYKNVFATYSHMHALGTKEWARGLYNQALCYKKNLTRINNISFQESCKSAEVNLFG